MKLEVIGDERTLFPDVTATIEAARILVQEGFTVLPYVTDDPVACQKLAALGCAAVMPLGAPIGSGMGIRNPANLRIILETVEVPVIVDAGVGTASDAAIAMELGCTAVLMNTGIAAAKDPGAHGAGHAARGRGRPPRLRIGAHAAAAVRLGVEPARRNRELLSAARRAILLPRDRSANARRTPRRARVAAAVRGGVDWIQVRERTLEGAALLALVDARGRGGPRRGARPAAARAREPTARRGARRGRRRRPPRPRRRSAPASRGACSRRRRSSVSRRTRASEALAARDVDYVQLAPIFAPLSKPAERPALGLAALAAAAAGRFRCSPRAASTRATRAARRAPPARPASP